MDQAIGITVTLTITPGHEADAGRTAEAIATEAGTIEGVSVTHSWDGDAQRLVLHCHAIDQETLDRHLAAHGPLYAGFEEHGPVVGVTVAGPADEATMAAMLRLSDAAIRI